MHPFFHLFGVSFSAYFSTLSIVYTVAILYFFKRFQKTPFEPIMGVDFLIVVFCSGVIGARLLYVFFQEPIFYFQNPSQILAFWKGGFIYYGGFLGACLGGYFFLRKSQQNIWPWLDVMAPVAAFGYGFGRLACFLNGCCYGAESHGLFAMHFPHLEGDRHPTQLYALVFELCTWILLVLLEKNSKFYQRKSGFLFSTWLGLHGMGRLVMEHYRADPRGSLVFGISISSFISIILIVVSVGLILRLYKESSRHP